MTLVGLLRLAIVGGAVMAIELMRRLARSAACVQIAPSDMAVRLVRLIASGKANADIADSAAGYAALSLMPAGTGVLTAEFKINLLAPAEGKRILARGRVVKAGRTLTLAQAEVFASIGGQEKLIALLTSTLMAVKGRDGISD